MRNHELLAVEEQNGNGMSVYLKPNSPVVITPGLVEEIRSLQDSLAEKYLSHSLEDVFYVVWYLDKHAKCSCRGLDFTYIYQCVKDHKDHDLEHYINRIFNLIFLNYIGLGLPVINCSIVTRPLTGFSQEFFLMNQICFLYNNDVHGIQKFKLCDEMHHLSFKDPIYEKNQYFFYRALNAEKMKDILEHLNYEAPDLDQIEIIRAEFERLNEETITRIYDIASRDIRILERMGCNDQFLR